ERSEQLLYSAWREEDVDLVAASLEEGPHQLGPAVARRLAHALRSATGFPATRTDQGSLVRPEPTEAAVTVLRFTTNPDTSTDYVLRPRAWTDERLRAALDERPVVAVIDDQVARHHRDAVDALLAETNTIGRLELQGGEQCKSAVQLGSLLAYF